MLSNLTITWIPTAPADILAAALTRLSMLHWRKVAVKKKEENGQV